MLTLDEFHAFIERDLVYEQKLISIIDYQGRQILLDSLGQLHSNYGKTIKVEGMEKYNLKIFQKCKSIAKKYNHKGPVTCHAFRAFENSGTFPMHTDPDDVLLYVVWGKKIIKFEKYDIVIKKGGKYFIPANTPHRAVNEKSSLMLSFGLEKFLIDKL